MTCVLCHHTTQANCAFSAVCSANHVHAALANHRKQLKMQSAVEAAVSVDVPTETEGEAGRVQRTSVRETTDRLPRWMNVWNMASHRSTTAHVRSARSENPADLSNRRDGDSSNSRNSERSGSNGLQDAGEDADGAAVRNSDSERRRGTESQLQEGGREGWRRGSSTPTRVQRGRRVGVRRGRGRGFVRGGREVPSRGGSRSREEEGIVSSSQQQALSVVIHAPGDVLFVGTATDAHVATIERLIAGAAATSAASEADGRCAVGAAASSPCLAANAGSSSSSNSISIRVGPMSECVDGSSRIEAVNRNMALPQLSRERGCNGPATARSSQEQHSSRAAVSAGPVRQADSDSDSDVSSSSSSSRFHEEGEERELTPFLFGE